MVNYAFVLSLVALVCAVGSSAEPLREDSEGKELVRRNSYPSAEVKELEAKLTRKLNELEAK